jgi:DNA-binding transcriptional ArsR family regulator
LDLLRRGDRAASQIATEFRHTKSTMSGHLRILESAGLLHQRREGRFRVYSLRAGPIRQAAAWMKQF